MRPVILTVLALVLAGCGSTTAVAPKDGLKTLCPQVEAAMPADSWDDTAIGDFTQVTIPKMVKSADLEARNALEPLVKVGDDYASGGTALGLSQEFLAAVDSLATRCKAAGSSALQ